MQEWWTGSDRNIVVATIAFGMGIDKADVRYVYHLNLPEGPRVVLAGDRPRRTRRRAEHLRALRLPGRHPDARELRVRRHADARGARRRCSTRCSRTTSATQFAVSEYELSTRHDVRPLVLKTILTYLELDGLLRAGHAVLRGLQPPPDRAGSFDDVFAAFDPARAEFLAPRRRERQDGPDLDEPRSRRAAAAALGEERSRIVAALGYLEEQGLVELKPSEARQRYTLLAQPDSIDELLRASRRALRAARAGRDRADRARRLARHPRRLPGQRARRLLRRERETSRAGTAASA